MPLNTLSAAKSTVYIFMNDEIMLDANVLYKAYKNTLKANPQKPQTQRFEVDWLHNIAEIREELATGKYMPGGKTQFVTRERGKVRLIRAAQVKDKVVQHAFTDEVLLPALRPKLIYDNYASLQGRGVALARKRLDIMLQRYWRKYRNNKGYILLMDFSGYYDNLRHDIVYKTTSRHITGDLNLSLLKKVIDSCQQDVSFLTDEEIIKIYNGRYKSLDYIHIPKEAKTGAKMLPKGMDIGDQVAQAIAVYTPTPIDNFVKIVAGEPFYGRYMDDSFIINPDKERLRYLLTKIETITRELGIILNPKKVRILPLGRTFTFMQVKYFMTDTGKVVKRINPKRVTAMRRKLKKLARMVETGKREYWRVHTMYHSWRCDYFRMMSKAQRRRMDALYNELFAKEMKKYELLQIRPRYRQIYWNSTSGTGRMADADCRP